MRNKLTDEQKHLKRKEARKKYKKKLRERIQNALASNDPELTRWAQEKLEYIRLKKRQYANKYYNTHPEACEKRRQYVKAYQKTHKDIVNKRQRERRADKVLGEKIRAYNREYMREYRKTHKSSKNKIDK